MPQWEQVHAPREQVRRETPVEELGRPRRALLLWEELKAQGRVGIVEGRVFVHPSHDDDAAVEDTSGSGVPALLQQVEVFRILENRAPITGRRCARLKETYSLITGVNCWVPREQVGISANARLKSDRQ